ncbi:unnamed protein product [Pieris macdunnoughi]|uniref:Uncharacterized protein n=1 Tax=Pieris macdunnoughi TaxID=345717 RepID=A0A821LIV0_9NEOP|nr:unnamed protein product [Pieris macdunnoughi]
MATEVVNNAPDNTTKEKEMKEDAPADNTQTKEENATEGKVEEKVAEEKKAEPAAPKPNVHKANFQQDMVYLYQFARTPLLLSTSPYCLKVETWLRLAGIKYEIQVLHYISLWYKIRFTGCLLQLLPYS